MEPPLRPQRISEMEGQSLGPYQITDVIGRGGMAVVYRALQPALRRYVAIKVLPGYFVHEEGFRVRFQQEAETVARLEHPNILPIYDYGQEGDIPYIVMPLVSGGTLREWLAESVPLESALQVFSRVLNALEYAHTRQPAIVHRDIKPSNILMSQGDWPLLTDFGIAKIVEPTMRVTRSGTMVGTPEYMSPEQSEGKLVDHRADIYAMGIMLYEMLTGRLPFTGQTPVAIILQHVKDEVPSPRSLNPALSPVWDDVIQRALAKNAEDRYPTAKAMDEGIQRAWRQAKRDSGLWRLDEVADLSALAETAERGLTQGDWQRVIAICGQILEIDPAHAQAVHLLTQAHEALRRERVEQQGLKPSDLVRQADEALEAEHYTAASRYYQDALQLDPSFEDAQSGLSRAQHLQAISALYYGARADMEAERWADAAAKLDELQATMPDFRDTTALRAEVATCQEREVQLSGWYDEGLAALERRDWPTAATAFRMIVAAAPNFRDAQARLTEAQQTAEVGDELSTAEATLAAGRAQEAVALLETVARKAPRSEEARTLLARARAQIEPATLARQVERATPPEAPVPEATTGERTRPSVQDEAPTSLRQSGGLVTPPATDGGTEAPTSLRPAVAPERAADEAAASLAAAAAVGAEAETPASVAVAAPAPVVVPAAAPRRGNALKLVLPAGLAALALVAFLAYQQTRPTTSPEVTRPTEVVAVVPPQAPTATPAATAADFFPSCASNVFTGNWSQAATDCEKVRDMDASFPGLSTALATTYLNLGKQQLADGGQIAPALDYFDKALAARPDDAEAEQQRLWAKLYQDGDAALAAEDWPTAAEKFQALYTVAPEYLASTGDRAVKPKLFAAQLGLGQSLLDAGEYAEAQRRCDQALALVSDSEAALACRASALAALATPTPRPLPPTAVPTVRPPTAIPPTVRPPTSVPPPPPTARPSTPVPPPTRPLVVPPPTRQPG